MTPASRSPGPSALPARVTLPLLEVITRSSLDEDYQHVADLKRAAHEAAGTPVQPRQPGRRAAAVVGLFGLLIVIAAVQTSRNAGTAQRTREELITQITSRHDEVNAQQRTISQLRSENDDLDNELADVTRRERAAASEERDLAGITGFAPVSGPGVRFTVDDSPDGSPDGVIRDEDLAILIDGLWAAGAEAIAVNGHRITALSGIRTAGSAIHIRTQPLRPPYTVLAIGNPDTLEARFAETAPGITFHNLALSFHFVFDTERDDSLSLPGALRPEIRSARVLPPPAQPPNQEVP